MKKLIIVLFPTFLFCSSCADKLRIPVYVSSPSSQTHFAISQSPLLFDGVELAYTDKESSKGLVVYSDYQALEAEDRIPGILPGYIAPEGYVITRAYEDLQRIYILSNDSIGAMYGILDVAEELSFGGGLEEVKARSLNPSLANRFIKFNLPWSSYRQGKALSLHEQTCRDTSYWEAFLNMMVVNRFNRLSLWNLHPFTYMIRSEHYPEASPFNEAELEEWKSFWHTLFRMAHERGIETYLVNWNIFTSPEFAEAHDLGAYLQSGDFWGNAENSELIEAYTRACVRQVIDEYPLLSGIGLTLGERMGGMTAAERRDWVDRTIISGMNQACRKVKLLYRAPLSAGLSSHGTTSKSTEELTRSYLDTLGVPEETLISFKYNWSHGHSADQLFIVHGGKLTDTYWNPVPENYSVLWTVRNEDFFMLRWGQPDFVRGFLNNNLAAYTSGCILGSECYIPAADYFSKDTEALPFTYAFERQWLWYSIWGRLLYDRETPDELFAEQLNHKFNIGFGAELLDTWKTASEYYHLFNSFYKGTWDATNYAEAFTSLNREEGRPDYNTIITMDLLGNRPVLDTTRFVNIQDFVRAGGQVPEGRVSPLQLADLLKENGEKVLTGVKGFKAGDPMNKALEIELTDLEQLAWLQLFFAWRIEATLLLAEDIHGGTGQNSAQIDSHLARSLDCWREIIRLKERYNRETIPYMFNEELNYRSYLDILEEEAQHYHQIKTFRTHDLN